MEPGIQTPEETLDAGVRLLPRLAPGCWCRSLRTSGPGGALRLRLSHSAEARREVARRPAGTTEDFTDLHAWCEVYLPGAGWVGLDPTSGLFAGEGHIPVCRDAALPLGRAPISGAVDEAEVLFDFDMRVDAHARSAARHQAVHRRAMGAIDALGDEVDADLEAGDVRLTMGGEPTFVSIDDLQSAEWNTAAVGPTKRALADDLIRRLRDAFRAGRLAALRPGQMVSRRNPAALGVRAVLAHRRRADVEEPGRDRARIERADARPASTMPSASLKRPRNDWGRCRATPCRPSRISGTWLQGSGPADECRSLAIPSWKIPKSAHAWRGCSNAA